MEERIFGHRYRLTERIGSGGMAEVFKAVDETLGRTVAVKVLHPRYAADPTFTARFRQEAQAAANLQSPYIVNIYDWGQDGDTYYIVMEYVRGTDLKTLITQKGPLSSKRVAEIGAQVCSALSVAHGYDIIHRDIKPHNIMVTPDGSVKVMDFGIARAGNTTMTQTGSVLGTAHYVSPEQAQGRELKAQSDLYSLGVVLYEASTGRLPFDADTPVAVALKQVNEQPVRPTRVNPNVSADLERVIGRALAKDPAKRYATAEEMRHDLLRVAAGATVVGSPVAGGMALDQTSVLPQQTSVLPQVGAEGYSGGPSIRPVPNKRRVWPWIALVVVLITVGLIGAYTMGLIGKQGVPVPDCVGKRQIEAESQLVEAGFKVGTPKEKYDSKPAGTVIDQSPVANAVAEKGSVVTLTISKGPEMVDVPALVGLTESQATTALDSAGLVADPQPSEYRSDVEPGKIFEQTPSAGEQVKKGSKVQYVVSRGIETTKVPNVVGLSESAAADAIRKAGFAPSTTKQYDDTVPAGKVISQSPAKNTVVAVGSTVSIVVSRGPQTVSVPDTIGRSLADATAALSDVGLVGRVKYEPHSNNGTVLEQDPSPGTKVNRGTTVNLLVDATAP